MVLGKPERPEAVISCGLRPVRYSDLDMNGHMNNIKYMDILCDALKLEERKGFFLKSAALHYVGQTMPGQTLALETGELPNGHIYISGSAEGKRTFEASAEPGAL
jgi:acyl-ACP thioesterase